MFPYILIIALLTLALGICYTTLTKERKKNKELQQVEHTCEEPDVFNKFTNSDSLLVLAQKFGKFALWELDVITGVFKYSNEFYDILTVDEKAIGTTLTQWKNCLALEEYTNFTQTIEKVSSSRAYGDLCECYVRVLCDPTKYECEHDEEGEYHHFLLRASVTSRSPSDKALKICGAFINVNTILKTQQKLKALLEFDALTNVKSRFYFQEKIQEIAKLGLHPVSFIYCDVDGLKLINDNVGHLSGDILLKNATNFLKAAVRSTDMVARLGGDEFMVVILGCDEENLNRIYQKIIESIAIHNDVFENIPVFISCATLTVNMRHVKWEDIFKVLDTKMMENKLFARKERRDKIKTWIVENGYTLKEEKDERVE